MSTFSIETLLIAEYETDSDSRSVTSDTQSETGSESSDYPSTQEKRTHEFYQRNNKENHPRNRFPNMVQRCVRFRLAQVNIGNIYFVAALHILYRAAVGNKLSAYTPATVLPPLPIYLPLMLLLQIPCSGIPYRINGQVSSAGSGCRVFSRINW